MKEPAGHGTYWDGEGYSGRPHPAFGHPLPEGEGLSLGRVTPPSDPLSLWERVGVRVPA